LDVLVCLLLAAVTLAAYVGIINHEFIVYDDSIYVTENRRIHNGLTPQNIAWSFNFEDKAKLYWHPLTWLSHILDCHLYGLNPGMHHLTNLIIHIASSLLLFLVFKRMTGELWKSIFVAALFALHPINVDSVAWVAERKNVLSTFFWVLTILSYTFYCEVPRLHRYLLTVSLFALGLLAKPMLVTLPCVLLLLDYWPLGRLRPFKIPNAFRLVLEKIPFFILSVGSICLSTFSVERSGAVITMEEVPLALRVSNALVSYVSYIWKTIWPYNLAVHYPFPDTIALWKTISSGLFLALGSLLIFMHIKRKPYLSVGWLWFLGTLVPVIGLVQIGLWPAMADRWAYVPLIGLFIMIAWGAPEFVALWRQKTVGLVIITSVFLSVLTATTVIQAGYWNNSISLFEHTLHVTSDNSVAHNNLGVALANEDRLSEAANHYLNAIRINPDYADAHYNLGVFQIKQGRPEEAINHYSHALTVNPKDAIAHNALAFALTKQGKINEAIDHYYNALEIKPDFAEAHNGLGVVLANQGNIPEAISHFSAALQIKPYIAGAHNNLGIALQKQGKTEEAINHYSHALTVNPKDAIAHNALAFALTKQGKIDKAIDHYYNALEIKPDFAEAHNGLGVVLANQGKIPEAISHFSEALRIDPTHAKARSNLKNALKVQED
jgi:tetratricopeptide (TPR) repeat protein